MKIAPDSIPPDFSRLKLFFALSRTPHGLIDMTTPMFAACLWLGHIPSFSTTLPGIITVFAGYTAVYAFNDIVDYRLDKERLQQDVFDARSAATDLDATMIRHPLAQGLIPFRDALLWATGWSAVALTGAFILNPLCVWIFLSGCILEAVYCLLFRISPFRTLVNGIVKTLGAVAAVFAVDPSPSALYLVTLFSMLFLWEIGGQNIPNDCMDREEDIRLRARTVPVCYGLDFSAFACVTTLAGAIFLSFALLYLSPLAFGWLWYMVIAVSGAVLLMVPALSFYKDLNLSQAGTLFNRASYYPMALFFMVLLRIVLS